MLLSMTGYGRATVRDEKRTCSVEIKSVNHRYLDITFQMPKTLAPLEDRLKRIVSDALRRGKVNVEITVADNGFRHTEIEVNWALIDRYAKIMQQMTDRYQLAKGAKLSDFMGLPDVFTVTEVSDEADAIEPLAMTALDHALQDVTAMRLAEGGHLQKDLEARLSEINACLKKLATLAESFLSEYRERLERRMREFLEDCAAVDESRLLNEVAVYADKTDINEELTRLKSHCDQFYAIMEEENPKGRKLDFLLQEMHREINTIGAKTGHIAASQAVITIKNELEKLREQVQNIE
ncbi:YicC/YloC family endoribonuclease [Camelliibacillus cellulosilyticus]|uniref:YicC/YloC family endoribonuclease n=1 Tax=Camelliibacillus cellulosilyticus TaxID=2174486 RepID=A0ABV9GG48_9BACL